MLSRKEAQLIYQSFNTDCGDPHIFHYTSTEVLDALLEKCTFRASNIFYLNDAEEYNAGIKALNEIMLKQNKTNKQKEKTQSVINALINENGSGKINEGVYTISFSQEEDLLSQWITYAKEGGVAIELDSRLILQDPWYGVEEGVNEVEYDKNELRKSDLLYFMIKDCLHKVTYDYNPGNFSEMELNQNPDKGSIMWLASYFKQEGFSAEKEIRISSFPVRNYNQKARINYYYMSGRGLLRPYINISMGYIAGKKGYFNLCLPLKTITVGPAGNQQAVYNSIVHRIKYGTCHIYDYNKNEKYLKENILSYILEVILYLRDKEIITDISDDLKDYEKRDKPYEYIQNLNNINELIEKVQIDKEKELVWIILQSVVESIEKTLGKSILYYDRTGITDFDSNQKRIIQEIQDNFFFSKEGILIKRSKIPYIF